MIFNTIWTILLGVVGGIVSSLIVSRVFFIQNEYHIQIEYVDGIIRRIGYISAYLQAAKAIFEVSYDQDVAMEKEMKEKGYHCEMEYYANHTDTDWISKNDVLEAFRKEIEEAANSINKDISNNNVKDAELYKVIGNIATYVNDVSSIKEFTFSRINELKRKEQDLLTQYDICLRMSGKKMISLIVKDKVMIVVFGIVCMLAIGAVVSYCCGV